MDKFTVKTKSNHARMENNLLVIHPKGSTIEVTQAEFDDYPGKFERVKTKTKQKSEVT